MRTTPTVLDGLALLTATADDLVVATVRDTHVAIMDRVSTPFRAAAGLEQRPPGITDLVYALIGGSLRGASKGLGAVAATGVGPRLEAHGSGRFTNAAVNGLIGDVLAAERPSLGITMAVRLDGRDLAPAEFATAFPAATGKVAVFLHGLCEDESAWSAHRDRVGTTYADELTAEGWTVLMLRANSGLPIATNAASFDRLMDQVSAHWPLAIERIALVGHSQGGLVMRTATSTSSASWVSAVTDLITLGTPHHGSHIARSATSGSAVLRRLPETAAFGRILERRSVGIRDLDKGLPYEVAVPEHVRVRLVSASLGRGASGWIATTMGDLLVQPQSALGTRAGRRRLASADTLHLGRAHHFHLLNDPRIHAAIKEWLR